MLNNIDPAMLARSNTVPTSMTKPTTTTDILEERSKRYGLFTGHAKVTQNLKIVISNELLEREKELDADMQEALDMICHKIGRIINGDQYYEDSWRDIAGYSQLVADSLLGVAR